jgi:long-chain fatty acid transport protein
MRLSYAQKFSLVDVLTPRGAAEPAFEGLAAQSIFGDMRMDYTGVDHGLGWSAGILYSPLRWLSLGMSYNGATAANFEGDLALVAEKRGASFGDLLETFGYKLPRRLTVEMVIPHALQWGINVSPASWIELGVDYRLWLYNLYSTQEITPIYDASADEELEEPMSKESLSRDKRYGVSYEISAGVLARPWRGRPRLEVMAGIFFDKSPIPDETFTLDNPSIDQVGGGVGLRHLLWDHWRVALSYMMLIYIERDVRTSETSPPTNVRGRGLAHVPGIEVEYLF